MPPTTQNKELQQAKSRQPYVEQIMRGTKTIEYRSTRTHIRAIKAHPGDFPTGLIIGTVEITNCTGAEKDYHPSHSHPKY